MRAQTTLPTLGVALLLLSVTATLGIAVADDALADSERDAVDRQAVVALSERLVSPAAPLTDRENVLNRSRANGLTETRLRETYGLAPDADARVRLGDETLVGTGVSGDAAAFERIVLVRDRQVRTVTPDLTGANAVTLPRRAGRVTLRINPPAGTTVARVLANDRIALRNASGLRGRFDLALSRFETTTLRVRAVGSLPNGSVTVRYRPAVTSKARLVVRVDG